MILYQNINNFSKTEQKKKHAKPRPKVKSMSFSGWTNSFNYLPPKAVEPFSVSARYSGQQSLGSSGLTWDGGTAEQLTFLKKVYDINLAKKTSKTFVNDVPDAELSTVEGRYKLRTQAAQSAIQMLVAARAAITASGKNVELGLSSAYRSASHQFNLWNDYVVNQYYPITKIDREAKDGGEHGEAAAQHLASYTNSRVAVPGYSNHNNGLALDLSNTQDGTLYRNKTKKAFTDPWRTTWLWEWLVANAATYNFYQNTNIDEPWHWVYREQLSSGKNINWTDDLKMKWIDEKLKLKTSIIDEPGHNLCLLPFPEWIDATTFQADFRSNQSAHANAIIGTPANRVTANYFVIHDTAGTRKVTSATIPSNARGIHLWLNNDGALQAHDWNHRGNGTKVERGNNGCFVHTELVRHPKLDEAISGVKDAGTYYTNLQYELLAYAYVICSMRKGSLLEVTIHREVDRSVEYHESDGTVRHGHNDPQHFNMYKFYTLVDGLLKMPVALVRPPLLDFTYGIEQSRIMQHRQDNWSGYRNEFIPYVESRVTRAEQYRPIARRTNSAGQVVSGNALTNDVNVTRRC